MPVIGFTNKAAIAGGRTGVRVDPYMAYNFHLEIDGLIVGGFEDVSGLSITTSVKKYREGGRNDSELVFAEYTSFPDLVLSRGLSDVDQLYGWYYDVTQGKVKRKSGTIYLLDDEGIPVTWWDFTDAFPVKWEGPALSAKTSAIATEKLTLVHEGLKRSETSRLLSAFRNVIG
ncbi:MAG: phage tail protein [Leptospirales bacterium]|jgi:phage tail-like protein